MANARRRSARSIVEADLNIMPLMNLFVVLIPMLLLSAVFVELSVIDMNLPTDQVTKQPKRDRLDLSVQIGSESYSVQARGWKTRTIARDEAAEDKLGELLIAIAQKHPDNKELVILSASQTPYQDIVSVMDASIEAGVPGVSLGESASSAERVAR